MDFGPIRLGDHLASLTPGRELGAVLGALDPGDLCGHDAVAFVQAQYRQVAHEQGRLLLAVSHVARCGSDGGRHGERGGPDEWSSKEVKAALGLTRRTADGLVADAIGATVDAPEIGAAMLAGELDLARARLLHTLTVNLSESTRASVLATCLPLASLSGQRQTTGQLAEHATTLAMALDPHAKSAEYDTAVRQRRVVASRNPDGTSDLAGHQLPPERVAAAAARIDTLAKTAKRDGDPRPIDHLRAEIFLCTTEGTWAGLDDADILAALRATRPDVAPGASDPQSGAVDASLPARTTPAGKPLDGIELGLLLYTALGLDLQPADLAGHGPLHAAHAVDVLSRLGAAQWRWILLDSTDHLVGTGLTPARPAGFAARSAHCDSVVNLHVHAGLLEACLKAAAAGDIPDFLDEDVWETWRPVLLDIAKRAAEPPPPPEAEDPDRRFAGARLRREVQIAHGRCIGVGCRAPARRSDLDHRHDHAKGGKTTSENSAPLCRHDHRGKHEGGWTLARTEHGHRWTSRLGHTYDVPDRPVWRQLPDPAEDAAPRSEPGFPEPDGDHDGLGRHWQDSTLLTYTPPDIPPF
ncbi:MAG: DUF222 domain-containing protein [Sporichthyaceae bacterium]